MYNLSPYFEAKKVQNIKIRRAVLTLFRVQNGVRKKSSMNKILCLNLFLKRKSDLFKKKFNTKYNYLNIHKIILSINIKIRSFNTFKFSICVRSPKSLAKLFIPSPRRPTYTAFFFNQCACYIKRIPFT